VEHQVREPREHAPLGRRQGLAPGVEVLHGDEPVGVASEAPGVEVLHGDEPVGVAPEDEDGAADVGQTPGQAGIGRASFHEHYAAAEGKLRSARAYLFDTWTGVEETIRGGEAISTRQRTLMWHALQHATWAVPRSACGST
jgi:hypothetical protein